MPPDEDKLAVDNYNAFVIRHTWRNFWLNVADGGVYAIGVMLAPSDTVLPGFISDCVDRIPELSDYKKTLVGLLAVIISACFMMPQQLWAARLCEGRARLKKLLIVVAVLERLPWLFLGVMTGLLAGRNTRLALYLFFLIIFCYQFIIGIVSPVWQEVVAKVTPVHKRGILFGVRESIGGALGFGALLAANRYVPRLSFPANYTVLFLAVFAAIAVSVTPLFFLKEAPYPIERRLRLLRDYMRDIIAIVRADAVFQRYFWCRALFSMAQVACPALFAVRAIEVLGKEATVGLMVQMTMVITLSRMVISVFVGQMGDWFGYRLIMALSSLAAAVSILCALLASHHWGFYVAYALATFSFMSFWLGHSNYILELAPLEKRPSYISLDNMAGLPFVWAPLAGGYLADKFHYTLPFTVGIILALAATVGFFAFVAEPRKDMRKDLVS